MIEGMEKMHTKKAVSAANSIYSVVLIVVILFRHVKISIKNTNKNLKRKVQRQF
jgi:hypothetical protein